MYKHPVFLLAIAAVFFIACGERKPFVEHKLKFEKVSDSCRTTVRAFKMTSNFGGERYEFEWCLPRDFTKEQFTIERKSDTIAVSFKKPAEELQAMGIFDITLDIDSYPKYRFLTIDQDMYEIVPASK